MIVFTQLALVLVAAISASVFGASIGWQVLLWAAAVVDTLAVALLLLLARMADPKGFDK